MSHSATRLSNLHIGDKALIEGFTDDVMKQKLLEMGCLPGEEVTIDRFAPLGCPMVILVAGSSLALRLEEAQSIIVKLVS